MVTPESKLKILTLKSRTALIPFQESATDMAALAGGLSDSGRGNVPWYELCGIHETRCSVCAQ